MKNRQRIVDGRVVDAGGVFVSRSSAEPRKVPGAVLTAKAADELRRELREIDEAQHAALAAGDRYYLGVQP